MTISSLVRRASSSARLPFGVVACLALLVQQWLVPLHLVLHEHGSRLADEMASSTRAHASAAEEHPHHHPHRPSKPDGDAHEGDHRPHPAEDHLDEVSPALVAPGLSGPIAALLSTTHQPSITPESPVGVVFCEIRSPRDPPPKTAPSPRAPPFVA